MVRPAVTSPRSPFQFSLRGPRLRLDPASAARPPRRRRGLPRVPSHLLGWLRLDGVRLALALAALISAGCGTVCGDAIEICRYDAASEPDDCSGPTECASLCVIERDACDVNNPESAVALCIADCLEADAQP